MDTVEISILEGEAIRPMQRVEYDLLVSQGYFDKERVELLFGVVVKMPPVDPAHVEATNHIADLLRPQLGARARILLESSFAADRWSEPEPDVIVTDPGRYWDAHPDHAFLVIEVARSSLRRDSGPKARLYAIANVDEYWIVDHVNEQIEVFREPRDGIWQVHTTHRRGDMVSMHRFPDVEIAVADVLPPIA